MGQALVALLDEAQWLGISVITKLEFLASSRLSSSQEKLFEDFLKEIDVVDVVNDRSLLLEKILFVRKKYRLKLPDAIIVGSALAQRACLVTADQEISKKIKELQTISIF